MNLASFLVLATAVFVFYVLAGYPVLLAVLTRRDPAPIRRQWEPKSVSVLLPVHNGEAWIRNKFARLLLPFALLLIEAGATGYDGSPAMAGRRAL